MPGSSPDLRPRRPAECDRAQSSAAAGLAALGLTRGDRVALLAPSGWDLYHVALGALRSGIVPVLVNGSLLDHERRAILDDARCRAVLGPEDLRTVVSCPHGAELSRWPLARPMMYTSGTTGRPKGVWTGVLDEVSAEGLWTEEMELWEVDDRDRYVQIGPLYHSAPLRFAICTQLAGGEVSIPGTFDPSATAAAITRLRPTFTFAAPIHLQRLLGHLDDAALASFRRVAHAGAPCPPALREDLHRRFPVGSVWEFYGSTEGQFTVCSPADVAAAPGSVGRPRPGRRLRVDPEGVIWCAGPDFARFTYWDDPARTAQAWHGDEFTVGDIGRLDDGGYLWLEGRRDDLIISGGVNVYPAEVEAELSRAIGVDHVAVFGVPDPEWGQAVWAAVTGSADPDGVRRHAHRRLAPYKRPKGVLVVGSIPTTSTGKVQRHLLAEHFGLTDQPAKSFDFPS